MTNGIPEFTTSVERIPVRIDGVEYQLKTSDELTPMQIPYITRAQLKLQDLMTATGKSAKWYETQSKELERALAAAYEVVFVEWSDELKGKVLKLGAVSQAKLFQLVFRVADETGADSPAPAG